MITLKEVILNYNNGIYCSVGLLVDLCV